MGFVICEGGAGERGVEVGVGRGVRMWGWCIEWVLLGV